MKNTKSKEQQQREIEEKRNLREKQIAQLKASNQMLDDTRAGIIKRYGENSEQAKILLEDIDVAINQNLERGKSYLSASESEINSATYREPDKHEIDAYNERLKKRGLTAEEVENKVLTNEVVQEEKTPLDNLKERLKKLTSKTVKDDVKYSDGLLTDEEFEKLVAKNNETDDIAVNAKPTEEETNVVEYNNEAKVVQDNIVGADCTLDDKEVKDFDPRDISPEVMYDVIELPSHGECYANKKGKLPVAYLTAADENIIASPNLYNNGRLLDIILERKILDKTIKVKDLCSGDRDAIIVWLRATAYDKMFPINATNPETGKSYKTKVDLSKLKYKPFNLKGDENGHFDYTTSNGDKIKFKILSKSDNQKLIEQTLSKYGAINKRQLTLMTDELKRYVNDLYFYEGYTTALEAIDLIKEWIETIKAEDDIDKDYAYVNAVTNRMVAYTYSINGETNPIYIKNYIENMRSNEAMEYRKYVESNVPGIDLKITVNIPESDGGGSFESFLGIYDTIFVTI